MFVQFTEGDVTVKCGQATPIDGVDHGLALVVADTSEEQRIVIPWMVLPLVLAALEAQADLHGERTPEDEVE